MRLTAPPVTTPTCKLSFVMHARIFALGAFGQALRVAGSHACNDPPWRLVR